MGSSSTSSPTLAAADFVEKLNSQTHPMKPTTPLEAEMSPPPPAGPVSYPPSCATDEHNVVAGIPVVMAPAVATLEPDQAQYSSYWSTGLCDCFSDMRTCCLVCWCPCIAFGRIAEIVDKGTSSCCCCGSLYLLLMTVGVATGVAASLLGASSAGGVSCQWVLSWAYRGKLKESLNMHRSCCEECCVSFWCEPCALCQEYRELQSRGYDLSLGWEGNMKKQASTTPVFAPVAPTMER